MHGNVVGHGRHVSLSKPRNHWVDHAQRRACDPSGGQASEAPSDTAIQRMRSA
jgi:hypothetical protein